MRNTVPVILCFAVGACCCIGAVGCKPNTTTAASSSAPGAPRPDKAKEFIATLRKTPASQRKAYAMQHPEMVEGVNQSGDPNLLNEMMLLMREAETAK